MRIFEAIEGAVVFGILIVVFIRITDDTQLIDIPHNYMSLFMRPVLLASLALIYRVWMDGRKKEKS